MKNLQFFLLQIMSLGLLAQTTYPELDFTYTPMWYEASSKNLKSFDRQPINMGTRVTGFGSAESLALFEGEHASIQFPADKLPAIIVKMNTSFEDPSASIELVKLQVNRHKHQREYISGKAGMSGSRTTIHILSIDFKKLGDGVYNIIPAAPLSGGEYVLSVGDKKAFLFSIDGPNTDVIQEAGGPKDPIGRAIYRDIQRKKAQRTAYSQQ